VQAILDDVTIHGRRERWPATDRWLAGEILLMDLLLLPHE
jgi:hypothetical protein